MSAQELDMQQTKGMAIRIVLADWFAFDQQP